MSKIVHVQSLDHFKRLVASDDMVAFVFSADWCGPCRDMADDLERLAVHYFPMITFAKVDADDHAEILEKCNVSVLPTFMFVRGSEQVGHFIGGDITGLKDELKMLTMAMSPQLLTK